MCAVLCCTVLCWLDADQIFVHVENAPQDLDFIKKCKYFDQAKYISIPADLVVPTV